MASANFITMIFITAIFQNIHEIFGEIDFGPCFFPIAIFELIFSKNRTSQIAVMKELAQKFH